MHNTTPDTKTEIPAGILRDGANAAWPICLGYFPIGLALGVLAQKAGLPWWAVAIMSVLVFAGSAQFICVAMIAAGASTPAIILTTFVVNLRHVLMSSALAVYLQGINRRFLALYSYGITDESFAVNLTRFREGNWDRYRALAVNHLANSVWIMATVCRSPGWPVGASGGLRHRLRPDRHVHLPAGVPAAGAHLYIDGTSRRAYFHRLVPAGPRETPILSGLRCALRQSVTC